MGKNLRLHKKYGANPTICKCFYCGEATGEIAFLGAKYDGEAPMYMCVNLTPCEKCRELLVKDEAAFVVEMNEDKPTGRFLKLPKVALTESFRKSDYLLCLREDFEQIISNKGE